MTEEIHRKQLVRAYRMAPELLCLRMEKLFVDIVTPADIALHNDALKETLLLVSNDPVAFVKRVSESVLEIAQKSEENKEQREKE